MADPGSHGPNQHLKRKRLICPRFWYHSIWLLALILLFGLIARRLRLQFHKGQDKVSGSNDDFSDLLCRIYKETTIHSNHFGMWDEEQFLCSPIIEEIESDQTYTLAIPEEIKQKYSRDIEAGSFFVLVRGGKIEDGSVAGFEASDLVVSIDSSSHSRQLQQVGMRTILVLRVTLQDSAPELTGDEFRDSIFGYDQLTVQSQYNKCSAGKLLFEPAPIGDGVLEVRMPEKLISDFASSSALSNAAQNTAAELLGLPPNQHISSLADHVMICLPPGTGNWVAAAAMNHWRSVYNNKFCGIISASMHEIGHNLGLSHANENGNYLDYTSYMSAGHYRERYPQKCFNGQNHFRLGWFADRALSLQNVGSPIMVKLASFVDYRLLKESDDEVVLISIDDTYFLQFNQAKDYNIETEEKVNQITIVEDTNGATEMIAGLDMDKPIHGIKHYQGGSTLWIMVCETRVGDRNSADAMLVIISTDLPFCPGPPTPIPTLEPTNSPTTRQPTQLPSYIPTAKPTKVSSTSPSRKPTMRPSDLPNSVKPSHSPTVKPSNFPTGRPTPVWSNAPTTLPSHRPTSFPTYIPSVYPTQLPTSAPTKRPGFAPSSVPNPAPSSQPSHVPTKPPTETPSYSPTEILTILPTPAATLKEPTGRPTRVSSSSPSNSFLLSNGLTDLPTSALTMAPTDLSIFAPSQPPTDIPTKYPKPTLNPTKSLSPTTGRSNASQSFRPSVYLAMPPPVQPSAEPTLLPSELPSYIATVKSLPTPSATLSDAPSDSLSSRPSSSPNSIPSGFPSFQPTDFLSTPPSVTKTEIESENPTSVSTIVLTNLPSSSPSMSISTSASSQPTNAATSVLFIRRSNNDHDAFFQTVQQLSAENPQNIFSRASTGDRFSQSGRGDSNERTETSNIEIRQNTLETDMFETTVFQDQIESENTFQRRPNDA